MSKKTKKNWGGYFEFYYRESEDSKPIKFLARSDEDAELYAEKVGADNWGFKADHPGLSEVGEEV
jgi:hypothetical protein